ncbi:MAG: nucleoside recognition domain-containing protein [Methylocystaceae bacterium]
MRFLTQVIFIILLLIFMIIQPGSSMQAAGRGLTLWWQTVVPALLPFFIISELLIRLQVTRYLGKWLNPLMKPLFNLPGAAGLAVAMGYTSGFPVGALVSTHLYKEQLLTKQQASHLAAFTNNSSPLFIIGAVGVGMLNNQTCGYILAIAHYGSNLLVGWYLGRKNRADCPDASTMLVIERTNENLLGSSIRNSINSICQIGGFIIFFMVLTSFLINTGIIDFLVYMVGVFLPAIPPTLVYGSAFGLLELTQGAQTLGAAQAPLFWKLMLLSTLLSFSGLCIQAQVHSIISESGLSYRPYLKARLLQIPPALLLTWIGWVWIDPTVTTFSLNPGMITSLTLASICWQWLALLSVMLVLSGAINLLVYVSVYLTHRGRPGLNLNLRVKPSPNTPINHQHTGWHQLLFPHLRSWLWR